MSSSSKNVKSQIAKTEKSISGRDWAQKFTHKMFMTLDKQVEYLSAEQKIYLYSYLKGCEKADNLVNWQRINYPLQFIVENQMDKMTVFAEIESIENKDSGK